MQTMLAHSTSLNKHYLKIQIDPCEKSSGPPKSLGKEWSHCSFCATALREIATVQKDSC
jgi:hypothetical protein